MILRRWGVLIVLRWPLSKWLNIVSLKIKILLISLAGHLCALVFLLIIYKDASVYTITISSKLIANTTAVVFMPLHKSLQQSKNSARGATLGARTQVPEKTSKSTTALHQSTPASTVIVSPSKKENTIQSNKKTKKSVQLKKVTKKKEVVKAESKPAAPKAKEAKAPVLQKKAPIINTPVEAVPVAVPEVAPIGAAQETHDVLYVGQQEMEALQLQDYIQNELAQHWSPPAGLRSDLCCIITVSIGFDGTITKINLANPSGVLLFDGAARRAALKLQPPKWAYGKELSITFKP